MSDDPTVKLRPNMAELIDKYLEPYGYDDREEFVQDALRRRIETLIILENKGGRDR